MLFGTVITLSFTFSSVWGQQANEKLELKYGEMLKELEKLNPFLLPQQPEKAHRRIDVMSNKNSTMKDKISYTTGWNILTASSSVCGENEFFIYATALGNCRPQYDYTKYYYLSDTCTMDDTNTPMITRSTTEYQIDTCSGIAKNYATRNYHTCQPADGAYNFQQQASCTTSTTAYLEYKGLTYIQYANADWSKPIPDCDMDRAYAFANFPVGNCIRVYNKSNLYGKVSCANNFKGGTVSIGYYSDSQCTIPDTTQKGLIAPAPFDKCLSTNDNGYYSTYLMCNT